MLKDEKKYNSESKNGSPVYNNTGKPRRYSEDALNKTLLGKKLRVSLVNNQTLEGTLSNLGVYDLSLSRKVQERIGALIKESDKITIVLKAAISTVEVIA